MGSLENVEAMIAADKTRRIQEIINDKIATLTTERDRCITWGGDLHKASDCQAQIGILVWLLQKISS